MEQAVLREIFGWAHANRRITYMPIIKHPLLRKGVADTRRASFETDEWTRISAYLDEWAVGKGKKDSRVNSAHIYRRKLCRLFIHWMVNTDMRTGEVFSLRQGDIRRTLTDEAQMLTLRITVAQDTKTGSRLTVARPECVAIYKEVCELTGHTEADDFVFCGKEGKQLKGFYKTHKFKL
jgi:integrase